MNDRIRIWVATVAVLVGVTLVGCSAPSTGPDMQTSENWQARVVTIADHAAAGDHAAALQELAALESEALTAGESGAISAERATVIERSIALVRADLEAASLDTGVPEPAPTASDATDGDDDGSKGNGNGKDDNGKKKNP